jgi:hypothetical protein
MPQRIGWTASEAEAEAAALMVEQREKWKKERVAICEASRTSSDSRGKGSERHDRT